MSFRRYFCFRIKRILAQYFLCGAKTVAFLFWASIYLFVMKHTIFKGQVTTPTDDSQTYLAYPDNYSQFQFQGNKEIEIHVISVSEPDNATLEELQERLRRVHHTCREKRLSSETINSKEFFIDYQHNLVWCNIFKAASSSWLYYFNILGGYSRDFLARTRLDPITLARKKFARPSEEELREAISNPDVVSLIVVRDPFVRLLSAYRDKFERRNQYYLKIAKPIVAKYRKRTIKLFGNVTSPRPTFYEFVAYLIDTYKESKLSEFNEHWAPYYQFCSPCAVNFSVIAKTETLDRDSSYVISELGLNSLLSGPRSKRTKLRTVMNKARDGKQTQQLVRRYYSQLDRSMMRGLLEIYGTDFEMFGYDSKVYTQYGRKLG
ncbi:carbohydrate sulfotransferase 11 [Plutella xylostella]|uniref:carbohydrate sulfotransferase 11 n=1 Tax=Plutella xylostella TaxID=51655 RepID=UPI002032AE8E|nr:carbohydrate sulfotransferase 11 [Plutella xylostella]